MPPNNDFNIQYQFQFPDQQKIAFTFALRREDMSLRSSVNEADLPDWTHLDFHQCSTCPLKKAEHPFCPVAKEYYAILLNFAKSYSYEKVKVLVKVDERFYFKETGLQAGISSMIGIVNVTCGCPVLSKLRPMVRFHLPFGSPEETTFRTAAMFMLRKFFEHKNNKNPPPVDWNELARDLLEVGEVNLGLAERIRNMSYGDANINSLLILDRFAKITCYSI